VSVFLPGQGNYINPHELKAAMILGVGAIFGYRWCERKAKISSTQPLGDIRRKQRYHRRYNNEERSYHDNKK
jgi:hypothetical protein